ncbi:hypothetical protein ACJJWD_07010 [Comamonas testosteroni]|uniref:hypothetical protein n=1 Tax=Comamonas testosteroni TaxID=285 RepID=UPI003899CCD7
MSAPHIGIDEIKRLADDVRLIQNFAENHNFTQGLIKAAVVPAVAPSKKWDWPLIAVCFFVASLLGSIALLAFCETLSSAMQKFIFTLGLFFAVFGSIAIHKKFSDRIITGIAGVGLVVILLIGAGILTPKEAVDKIDNLQKNK